MGKVFLSLSTSLAPEVPHRVVGGRYRPLGGLPDRAVFTIDPQNNSSIGPGLCRRLHPNFRERFL
jgi:hypothetical protein